MATSNISLKLLIDKKANKVIFAEAGKAFVDILLYILSLPLATAISILTDEYMVGCLGDLYESIGKLGQSYMLTTQTKDSILNPQLSISAAELPLLPASSSRSSSGYSGYGNTEKGFVKGVVTYMVMDNLEVSPMSSISSVTLLNKFKIQDLSQLEERMVVLGKDEVS